MAGVRRDGDRSNCLTLAKALLQGFERRRPVFLVVPVYASDPGQILGAGIVEGLKNGVARAMLAIEVSLSRFDLTDGVPRLG